MIAYSLFINLYFTIIGYVYSRDRREWWDLSQEEKDELIRKYIPEEEYPDELEGSFPDGWFELDEWEKKAIMDKNLYEYYKDEYTTEFDFTGVHKNEECQGGRRCIIV